MDKSSSYNYIKLDDEAFETYTFYQDGTNNSGVLKNTTFQIKGNVQKTGYRAVSIHFLNLYGWINASHTGNSNYRFGYALIYSINLGGELAVSARNNYGDTLFFELDATIFYKKLP